MENNMPIETDNITIVPHGMANVSALSNGLVSRAVELFNLRTAETVEPVIRLNLNDAESTAKVRLNEAVVSVVDEELERQLLLTSKQLHKELRNLAKPEPDEEPALIKPKAKAKASPTKKGRVEPYTCPVATGTFGHNIDEYTFCNKCALYTVCDKRAEEIDEEPF